MKPKPIFLLPAVVLLVFAGLAAAFPGGIAMLLVCLSVVCVLPVFLSGGWTRWAGVILFMAYMGFAWVDYQDGKRYEEREIARKLHLDEKRKTPESKGFGMEKAAGEKN